MTYDSFGDAPASPRTRYTFTGRERDEFTGLYYYRARWYDAMIGRFISEDPIGFAGGDVNLYGYVKNNPVNFVDPNGTNPLVYLAVGAAAVGELLLHNHLFDRATNTFPQQQDPNGRKRHCYVNCMSTRIHLGNPIPGQIFSAGQEARNITNISGFSLQDTLGDIGANYYGSGAGYIIIYSCERLCEECQ